MEAIKGKLDRISAWWKGENTGRPLLRIGAPGGGSAVDLNQYWPTAESEPDLEAMVDAQIYNAATSHYLAESYPALPHSWGSRGTPMTMAAYLGGKVVFREDTVWVEPTIDDWDDFDVAFDEGNYWVSKSKELIEIQLMKSEGKILIWLPDLGDALTVFSLMRGVERLLLDLVERPRVIKAKVKEFTRAWIEAHRYFWSLYREKLPGDCSWLLWAPGKTYACQCDFSTMISPRMFREFVVPEIEDYAGYLDYIVWHLDGPDEIRHLDALLGIPEVKVYQIVPGQGRPPCASPLWLPQMKKIQERGRSVVARASNEQEAHILLDNLAHETLLFGCGGFDTLEEAQRFIGRVEHMANRGQGSFHGA